MVADYSTLAATADGTDLFVDGGKVQEIVVPDYCGSPPVPPPAGDGEIVVPSGAMLTQDFVPLGDTNLDRFFPFYLDATLVQGQRYRIVLHQTPAPEYGLVGPPNDSPSRQAFRIRCREDSGPYNDFLAFHDLEASGGSPYSGGNYTHLFGTDDPRCVRGAILDFTVQTGPSNAWLWGTAHLNFVEQATIGPSQTDLQYYNAAKAEYDACIAAGGLQGSASDYPPLPEATPVVSSLKMLTNAEGLRARILTSLRMREGDCIYNALAGFDGNSLLGISNPLIYLTLLRAHLSALPFVVDVLDMDVQLNDVARVASVSFTVETSLGESIPVTFETV